MIEISQLEFSHPGAGQPALRGVDLRVETGALFGLLGPNGAGKSTLLALICGLLPSPPGTIRVNGHDVASALSRVRAGLALVPQDYAFYPALSVIENLTFFAGVVGLRGAPGRRRIEAVTALTGLEESRQQLAGRCSGGVKRRLNIAIGLLNEPDLLLLDEPTVGIDPQARRFILEAVAAINRSGTTVVYTSHYMEEVESLCDDIAIIDHGRVLLQGPLRDLLRASSGGELEVRLSRPLSESQRAALESDGVRVEGQRLWWPGEANAGIDRLRALDVSIEALHHGSRDLEELFIRLTHRSLRD